VGLFELVTGFVGARHNRGCSRPNRLSEEGFKTAVALPTELCPPLCSAVEMKPPRLFGDPPSGGLRTFCTHPGDFSSLGDSPSWPVPLDQAQGGSYEHTQAKISLEPAICRFELFGRTYLESNRQIVSGAEDKLEQLGTFGAWSRTTTSHVRPQRPRS
jgi:hypothetical protein